MKKLITLTALLCILTLHFATAQSSEKRIGKRWLKNSKDSVCATSFVISIDGTIPDLCVARDYTSGDFLSGYHLTSGYLDTTTTVTVRLLKVPKHHLPLKEIHSVCDYLHVRELTQQEFVRLGTVFTNTRFKDFFVYTIGTNTVQDGRLLFYSSGTFLDNEGALLSTDTSSFIEDRGHSVSYIPVVEFPNSFMHKPVCIRVDTTSTDINAEIVALRKNKVQKDFRVIDSLIAICNDTLVQTVYNYCRSKSFFTMPIDASTDACIPVDLQKMFVDGTYPSGLEIRVLYDEDSSSVEAKYIKKNNWGGYCSDNYITLGDFDDYDIWKLGVTLHEMRHYYVWDLFSDSAKVVREYDAHLFELRANIACQSGGQESYDKLINDSIIRYFVTSPYFHLDTVSFKNLRSALFDSTRKAELGDRHFYFGLLSDTFSEREWDEIQKAREAKYDSYYAFDNTLSDLEDTLGAYGVRDGTWYLSFIFTNYLYRNDIAKRNYLLQKCYKNIR